VYKRQPLNYLEKNDWLFITYEELVINSYDSIGLLHRTLALNNLSKLSISIKRPASNIKLSKKDSIGIVQDKINSERESMIVKKWKNEVSEKDEEKAFEILSLFEIDVYSKGRFLANEKYLNFDSTESYLKL
jgi:hypothetical protein